MKNECFTTLHPWAYDLKTVDLKYIINKDQVISICEMAKSFESKVFWLTYFKPQLSCTSDEFVNALREVCEMSLVPEFFD